MMGSNFTRRSGANAMLCVCAAAMLHASTMQAQVHVQGFAPSLPESVTRINSGMQTIPIGSFLAKTITTTSTTTTCLRSSNGNDNGGSDDEAQRLKDKAKQLRNEAEKLRLTLGMKKIEDLQSEIRDFAKADDSGDDSKSSKRDGDKLQELKDRVQDLVRGSLGSEEAEKMLAGLSSFSSTSPDKAVVGSSADSTLTRLTEEEVAAAVEYMITLPTPVRETLARAAGYPSYAEVISIEELVKNLYAKNNDLSQEKLRRLYYQSFSKNLPGAPADGDKLRDEEYEILGMSKRIVSKIEEQLENSTRAMELFPRTVQDMDEELLPSEEDADVIFQLLDKSFMATEKPMKVQGGYIIRGVNKRKSAVELIDYLDGKLAKKSPEWTESYQMSFVEIYSDTNEELFEDAILITPNKFPPLAPKLLAGVVTAISLFSSFVYCIDTFGENTLVMERLKEATELAQNGGMYDVSWFNELLIPLLVTLGVAQGLHEAAHLVVAWSKQVKLTSPTILPSQALPYLSFQNRIKTSPKNYVDLFDIAFVGPVTGLSVSFAALLIGLQLTTTVDSTTAQLLPSLPVGYLTQSTLGGTIVDLVLGGGDGILINQDAATQVPLHPVAIGGFLGLIIHALDLVPVGSTDGGRMSQAILGRVWHLTFSSLIFFILFITSFTSDSGILLGFLFIYSFTQRDLEVPCKNEIDKVELPRAVAALVSWLVAALILVPLR